MSWTKQAMTATFQAMVDERHRARGQEIVRLRDLKGWSQETLAHEAKTSVGTVSRLERGTVEARGGTLRNFATALGVPVESLTVTNLGDADQVSQLDRIEAMLRELLALARTDASPAAIAEAAAERIEAQRSADTQAQQPTRVKGQGA